MKILVTILIFVALILSGVGSIIILDKPTLGLIFIGIGVLGGIVSFLLNEIKIKSLENNFEYYDKLLIEKGVGHPLLIKIKQQIKSGKSYKKVALIVDRVIREDPKNLEAISIKLSAYVNGIISNPSSFGEFDQYYRHLDNQSRKDFDNLIELAYFAVKSNPNEHRYFAYLGILLDIKGEHEKAREQFRISLKLSNNDIFWRMMFSNSYNRTQEHEKALKEVQISPGQINIGWILNYYLGRALYLVGDYKRASFYLECARGEAVFSYQIMLLLQDIYYILDRTKNSIVLGFMIATVYISISLKKAILEFIRTIGLTVVHNLNLFVIWLWNKTVNKKFFRGINKLLHPEIIYIVRAEVVMERGDNFRFLNMAKFLLYDALKYSPEQIKIWKYLLIIFEKTNDHHKALFAMYKIDNLDPDNPNNINLRRLLLNGKIKSAKTINFFEN